MSPPKKRQTENKGLPERWRFRYNAYYYRVPPDQEHAWDNKKEFRLGSSLSEAYKNYSDRIAPGDEIHTMRELFNRYRLEIIPDKAKATQITDKERIITLEQMFGDSNASSVNTQHCYKILDSMTAKRGATTANNHIALLSHVFTMAIRWGVISEHPIKGKLVKNKVVTKRHVPTRIDVETSLTVAPPLISAYVRFKMLTGLRQADILSLKRTCIKDDGLHITPRKTKASSGKSIIIQWDEGRYLKNSIQQINRINKRVSSVWLFSNRNGDPYFKGGKANGFKSIWQRWMTKAMKETNLQNRYSERSIRTFVGSEFNTAEEASRLLAHADVKTTKSFYREKAEKVWPLTPKK